jgi:hypothetical protein
MGHRRDVLSILERIRILFEPSLIEMLKKESMAIAVWVHVVLVLDVKVLGP